MFGFKKKKTWPYSYKIDPYLSNMFRIYKHKDWFMVIQMNGEFPLAYQLEKMEFIVERLNKGR